MVLSSGKALAPGESCVFDEIEISGCRSGVIWPNGEISTTLVRLLRRDPPSLGVAAVSDAISAESH